MALATRLEKASDAVVRRILTALCETDPKTSETVIACLDAFASEEYQSHLDGSERRQQEDPKPGTKRKAEEDVPKVYICGQCGEGFLEEHNNDRACFHHPGHLAVDDSSDFWADFDEPGHGIIDSEESRRDFPEGFRWDCCDEPGDGKPGCTSSRHESVAAKRRRTTLEVLKTAAKIDLTVE